MLLLSAKQLPVSKDLGLVASDEADDELNEAGIPTDVQLEGETSSTNLSPSLKVYSQYRGSSREA